MSRRDEDQALRQALAALPAPERRRLEALRTECGCRLGAIVMLGTMALWIAQAAMAPVPGRSCAATLGLGLLVLFASTLVGKLLGIGLARLRYRAALRRLPGQVDAAAVRS